MANSYDRYIIFAKEYIEANHIVPKRILTRPEQQAIAIYNLLSDGEWHTTKAIAQYISVKSHRHVNNIMQALRVPFSLASGQQGYCIPNKSTVLIA